MAALGQQVAGLTWGEFWMAHRPAVFLTLVSFPLVWAATSALRGVGAPAIVTLGGAGLVLVAACGLLVWRLPRLFLGSDGQWMAQTMRGFVNKLRRREGRPKLGGAFDATAAAAPDKG
jgi:hypothetical protein